MRYEFGMELNEMEIADLMNEYSELEMAREYYADDYSEQDFNIAERALFQRAAELQARIR